MSDQNIDASEDHGSEIRRPLRGRPPNAAKLSNGDDPRARAEQRAAEIRAQKQGREDDGIDEFKAPTAPPGWAYQWKRKSTYGREDVSHYNDLKRNGWEEVPANRHPDFMPYGTTSESIELKGMVLMECPQELVDDARARESRMAKAQVSQKAAQLEGGANTLLGNQTDKTARKLGKTYAPIAIPD